MKDKIKNNIKGIVPFLCIALQFSLLFLSFLFSKFPVNEFLDRTMGHALMNGVDISEKVNTFYLILFLLIPLLSISISMVLKIIFTKEKKETIKLMNIIAILGIVVMAFDAFRGNLFEGIWSLTVMSLFWINIFIILNKMFTTYVINKKFIIKDIKWSLISAIPFTCIITTMVYVLCNGSLSQNAIIIVYLIVAELLYGIINIKKINKNVLKKSYMFFLITPIIEYLFLELYNICNQREIFITNKMLIIMLIYLVGLIVTLVYYIINRKKKNKFYFERYYYIITIILIGVIAFSIGTVNIINVDFFEDANHAVSIYEFFAFKKLPIIENYDAHMLSSEVFGIIYGILNRDAFAAMFNIYGFIEKIAMLVLLYIFIKKIYSRDLAFLFVLFFPVFMDKGIVEYYIAIIPILALCYVYKKKNWISLFMFWISLGITCLYKLDIGFAISIATIVSLIFILIKERKDTNRIEIKKILISFFTIILLGVIIFVVCCLIKDINPVNRLEEFVKISLSNVNWACSNMGEGKILLFILVYIVNPLTIVGILINQIVFDKKSSVKKKIIYISLCIYCIIQFQRGIVRHSLREETTRYFLNLTFLLIAMYFGEKGKEKKSYAFIILYFILVCLNGTMLSEKNNEDIAVEKAIDQYTNFTTKGVEYNKVVDRVEINDKSKKVYQNLEKVINIILNEEESYIDFSNQTILYSLLGKEKPVYVNQSPALLSGEKSQQYFIKELENCDKELPIMLRFEKHMYIDDIANDYRYYLLSEYLYQRYSIVATVDDFQIWAENSRYDEILEKLKNSNIEDLKIVDKNYIKEEETENKNAEKWEDTTNWGRTNLGNIPYIWGKYDAKKDLNTDSVKLSSEISVNDSENLIGVDIKDINKENGNYLDFEITSEIETTMYISTYENDMKLEEYSIKIKKGTNKYRIRISGADTWYSFNCNKIGLKAPNNIYINSISICEADVLKEMQK